MKNDTQKQTRSTCAPIPFVTEKSDNDVRLCEHCGIFKQGLL